MSDKGVNVVRNCLAPLLGKSLYELDRMDLTVTSTLNRELQTRVGQYLKSLRDPAIAAENGLVAHYLLSTDQADKISYSFTLFERTPSGNQVRVQTDTTGLPFNINEGSKLELGSTAKLRTLATYLEIIAELHRKLSGQPVAELHRLQQQQPDILTSWVCSQLLQNRDIELWELLDDAMQRPYYANPGERFFTGGGIHTFGTLTAFVTGSSAENFSSTSALPLQVLKGMAPILLPEINRAAQEEMARKESGMPIARY